MSKFVRWLVRFVVLGLPLEPHSAFAKPVHNLQLGLDVFSNYTQVIPICDDSQPLQVSVNLLLYQIVSIDIQAETATLNIWLDMSWTDCTLTWNQTQYNTNVTQFPNSLDFWVPDLAWQEKDSNIRYTAEYYTTQPKQITSDGSVFMTTQLVPTIACSTDAYYYPFDVQICNMTFMSINHDITEMNVTAATEQAVMNYYLIDGRWLIASYNSAWDIVEIDGRQFASATYVLVVYRKLLFYMIFVASPLVIFALVTLFVFAIPIPTEEKISYSTNVLLNVCMYFLSLITFLPRQSGNIPILGQFLGALIALTACCVIVTVFVIRYYWNKELKRRPLPSCVNTFFNHYLAIAFRLPWMLKVNAEMQQQLYQMKLRHFNTNVNAALQNLFEKYTKSKKEMTPSKRFAAASVETDIDVISVNSVPSFGNVDVPEVDDPRIRDIAMRTIRRWRWYARHRIARRGRIGMDALSKRSSVCSFRDRLDMNPEIEEAFERKKKELYSKRKHKPNMTRHQYFEPCRAHWKRTAGNPWARMSYVLDKICFFVFAASAVLFTVLLFFKNADFSLPPDITETKSASG